MTRTSDPAAQALAAKAPEVVGGPPGGVGSVREAGDQFDQVPIPKAGHDVGEEEQGAEDRQSPGLP